MTKNIEKLAEIGEWILRDKLIKTLDTINATANNLNKESISYDKVLGRHKELYESRLENAKKLGVDISDIISQYESTIKEYGLSK